MLRSTFRNFRIVFRSVSVVALCSFCLRLALLFSPATGNALLHVVAKTLSVPFIILQIIDVVLLAHNPRTPVPLLHSSHHWIWLKWFCHWFSFGWCSKSESGLHRRVLLTEVSSEVFRCTCCSSNVSKDHCVKLSAVSTLSSLSMSRLVYKLKTAITTQQNVWKTKTTTDPDESGQNNLHLKSWRSANSPHSKKRQINTFQFVLTHRDPHLLWQNWPKPNMSADVWHEPKTIWTENNCKSNWKTTCTWCTLNYQRTSNYTCWNLCTLWIVTQTCAKLRIRFHLLAQTKIPLQWSFRTVAGIISPTSRRHDHHRSKFVAFCSTFCIQFAFDQSSSLFQISPTRYQTSLAEFGNLTPLDLTPWPLAFNIHQLSLLGSC